MLIRSAVVRGGRECFGHNGSGNKTEMVAAGERVPNKCIHNEDKQHFPGRVNNRNGERGHANQGCFMPTPTRQIC